MKTERHDLQDMNADSYEQLRESFYKTSDGLFGLLDAAENLQTGEKETILKLRRIFLEELGHLSDAGL